MALNITYSATGGPGGNPGYIFTGASGIASATLESGLFSGPLSQGKIDASLFNSYNKNASSTFSLTDNTAQTPTVLYASFTFSTYFPNNSLTFLIENGPSGSRTTTTTTTNGLPAAPTSAFALVCPPNGSNGQGIYLTWKDLINVPDTSNNIYYRVKGATQGNSTLHDFSLAQVDADISYNSMNVPILRRTQAIIKNIAGVEASYNKFTVEAVRLPYFDFSLNDASFSAATEFVILDKPNPPLPLSATTGQLSANPVIQPATSGLVNDASYAKVDHTKPLYLPPGSYVVGSGGNDIYGNNPNWASSSGFARPPFNFRWTIQNKVDSKLYSARHSDYSSNTLDSSKNYPHPSGTVVPVDVSASFALSNGIYNFYGFPLVTFPDNSGNILVDADKSWPVVVLQDYSFNKMATSVAPAITGYVPKDVTKDLSGTFLNKRTNTLSTTLPPMIKNQYYSFFDASINSTNQTRYLDTPTVVGDLSTSSILVQSIGVNPSTLTQYNMAAILNSRLDVSAASICEDISASTTNVDARGWISLLPKTADHYLDISGGSVGGSRNRTLLKTDISNGVFFLRSDTSANVPTNPNQMPLYSGGVTINVTGDFSNNKIHFWDAVWGWNSQGHNMFTYKPATNLTSLAGSTDLSAGNVSSALATAGASGIIDMTATVNARLTSLGIGTSELNAGPPAAIFANQQSLVQSIAKQVDLANRSVIMPFVSFPLNATQNSYFNQPKFQNFTNIRLINASVANTTIAGVAATGTKSVSTTFSLLTMSSLTTVPYIYMDKAGDNITITATFSTLNIKLNADKTAGTAGNNAYTLVGTNYTVSSGGVGAPVALATSAKDGDIVTFCSVPLIIGGVLPDVTANVTDSAICFHRGTQILTPSGYKRVEELQSGDLILSTKNTKEGIPVKSLIRFTSKKEDGALYCLPKNSLKENTPMNDLYMSGDHAFKFNGVWKHMSCVSENGVSLKKYTTEMDNDDIEYYHVIIDDYFAHTIVAEGVEVETCFEDKNDGIMMLWSCEEKCCTPLKCDKNVTKKQAEKPNTGINLIKGGEKKNKSVMVWNYDKKLNRNVPLLCNEINLPN